MERIENAIIGAGPYGLSIAAHLRHRRLPFRIFGRPMESWQHFMPRGMFLRSQAFASNLSDPCGSHSVKNYCRERGVSYDPGRFQVPLAEFLAYADWFCKEQVPNIEDTKLIAMHRAGASFGLSFSNGAEIRAGRVVLATGHRDHGRTLPALAALPKELASHASDHKDLGRFAGKDVTVVGIGQSGLETAALLNEQGAEVRVLARAHQLTIFDPPPTHMSLLDRVRAPNATLGDGWPVWILSELPQVFARFPLERRHRFIAKGWGVGGACWLKDRIVGRVPVLLSHEIAEATEQKGRLRLKVRSGADTTSIETDHVIQAIGFATDVARLPFLESGLRDAIQTHEKAPILDRSLESSVPGLFFTGMASSDTYGPVMRFVCGAKHAAPIIARRFVRKAD